MTVYQMPRRRLAERVQEQAVAVRPGRAAATAAAAVPYGAGWAAGKAVAGVGFGARWVLAAVRLGWDDARKVTGARAA